MVLSQTAIVAEIESGGIRIDPFQKENLKNASYLLLVSPLAYILKPGEPLDARNTPPLEPVDISAGYVLESGGFIILETREKITLSENIAGMLSTRPRAAQMGLDCLHSSLLLDPGTDNTLKLETRNSGPYPITIFPGTPIVQVVFTRVE